MYNVYIRKQISVRFVRCKSPLRFFESSNGPANFLELYVLVKKLNISIHLLIRFFFSLPLTELVLFFWKVESFSLQHFFFIHSALFFYTSLDKVLFTRKFPLP